MEAEVKQHAQRVKRKGFILPLMAVGTFMLLAICAWLVGTGMLTFQRSRLQNVTNLASKAALNALLRAPSNGLPPAKAAQDAANEIFSDNGFPAPFSSEPSGQAILNGRKLKAEIKFGEFVEKAPDLNTPGSTTTCEGKPYPCFVPKNPDQAVSVHIETTYTGLFNRFFRFLPGLPRDLSVITNSTSHSVQRCTLAIVDGSVSTTSDTHPMSFHAVIDPTTKKVIEPEKPALFVYNEKVVKTGLAKDVDRLFWENLPDKRTDLNSPDHFKSDYKRVGTRYGPVYVDLYKRPEPMNSFFLAINAAMRQLKKSESKRDKAGMLAFSKKIIAEIPRAGEMTQNYDFLTQVSNLDNIGKIIPTSGTPNDPSTRLYAEEPKSPNALELGFFPLVTGGGSNINYALLYGLSKLERGCDRDAKKSIIIATDALATYDVSDNFFSSNPPPLGSAEVKLNTYCGLTAGGCTSKPADSYLNAEARLLDQTNNGVLGRLLRSKVSVTVLLAGKHIQPNYCNRLVRSDPSAKYPFFFLDPPGAIGTAYGGFDRRNLFKSRNCSYKFDTNFVNSESHYPENPTNEVHETYLNTGIPCVGNLKDDVREACAWAYAGDTSYGDERDIIFRRVNASMAELSLQTGGYFCPLLPEADEASYDPNFSPPALNGYLTAGQGDTKYQGGGSYQRGEEKKGTLAVSVRKRPVGARAAECAYVTAGLNPVYLVRRPNF